MTAAKHTAILGMRDNGKAYRYTRNAWQRQSIPLYTARMPAAEQAAIFDKYDNYLPPKKKRPHAPGTHATRRNIAVAIPLAVNKRLQQHMRSTTLDDEDGLNKTPGKRVFGV